MNPTTQKRLRTWALAALAAGIWLTIMALAPAAVEQRVNAAEETAKPSVDALLNRNASDAVNTSNSNQTPQETQEWPSGTPSGTRSLIPHARITVYHATEAETDSTPCQGAMSGVDFCHPPYPIVANNCLKLGTKVVIDGKTFTVADRMASRFGCTTFDVLNGVGLPNYADVSVL